MDDSYKIVEVKRRKELDMFIKFPNILYKDCGQYVPALYGDQVKTLTEYPSLEFCEKCLWMVLDGDKVVGRIAAFINPRYNEHFSLKRCRFGWFDVIDSIEVARLLLTTAENWAVERGMTQIHGPLFYNTLGKQGMLVDGFENTPPFNCIYNFPYYMRLVEELGYVKEYDWLQYKLKADQKIPERLERIAERLLDRYYLKEANIEKLIKDDALVDEFFRVYNDSFTNVVYNFIPLTSDEIQLEKKSMIPFVSDKLSSIIMNENKDFVAYGIATPSISDALKKAKGSLFPFGWWHLLRAMRKCDTIDLMLNGVDINWQNKGISAVFHTAMVKKFVKAGVKWAITNPQIETNSAVNVWAAYDHELYMRRRAYIKDI